MRAFAAAMLLPILALMPGVAGAQTDAIAAFIPQADADVWKPITQKEQFRRYVRDTFNVRIVAGSAVAAAISLGREKPKEWNQDLEGYGQRLGNNLAKVTLRSTLEYGFAAAFKEDTRYISSGKTGKGARLLYALKSTYAARNSQGHMRFATSTFLANAGTSTISRLWAPSSWQGGRNMAADFAITSMVEAGYNVAREFGPDLVRKLKH